MHGGGDRGAGDEVCVLLSAGTGSSVCRRRMMDYKGPRVYVCVSMFMCVWLPLSSNVHNESMTVN